MKTPFHATARIVVSESTGNQSSIVTLNRLIKTSEYARLHKLISRSEIKEPWLTYRLLPHKIPKVNAPSRTVSGIEDQGGRGSSRKTDKVICTRNYRLNLFTCSISCR
jgi:hypothetical protein